MTVIDVFSNDSSFRSKLNTICRDRRGLHLNNITDNRLEGMIDDVGSLISIDGESHIFIE